MLSHLLWSRSIFTHIIYNFHNLIVTGINFLYTHSDFATSYIYEVTCLMLIWDKHSFCIVHTVIYSFRKLTIILQYTKSHHKGKQLDPKDETIDVTLGGNYIRETIRVSGSSLLFNFLPFLNSLRHCLFNRLCIHIACVLIVHLGHPQINI